MSSLVVQVVNRIVRRNLTGDPMTTALAKSSLTLLFVASAANAALPAPEHVNFPSLDRDAAGAPIAISALYFRPPQVAPNAKVPLIVAAHGGGGMVSTRGARRTQ